MNYSAISVRYSKALFQLANEKNMLDEVHQDILLTQQLISEVKEFRSIIESPVTPTRTKFNIVKEVFENKVNQITFNFFNIIFKNKRDDYLSLILRDFIHQYKSFKGIKTVKLTTVVPLTDAIKEDIRNLIQSKFNVSPDIEETINKDIVGGFILRLDDMQIDNSIATQLRKFKKELIR
jgi:F-type H+-transporting ATPase subunit delta